MSGAPVIPPIGNPENSSFVTDLNEALQTLANTFDSVVFRDGTLNMTGNLDINSKRIYNLPVPIFPTEPMRYGDVANFQGVPGEDGEDAQNPNYTYVINTLAPGASATLNATGTYPNVTLTFGIPRGDPGASGALGDGTYGGIVVSGTGSQLNVVAGHITLARMANLPANTFIGNNTGSSAVPVALTYSQTKTALSLNNVDNTSDVNKPISTATQNALDLKANASDVASKFITPVAVNADVTLSDGSHNNRRLMLGGGVTRTITANSSPSDGFICIIRNKDTVSHNLSVAGGLYKNGATSTVTSTVLAPGASVTLMHEGSGSYSATGVGMS